MVIPTKLKLTIIIENTTYKPDILGDHSLSILLEADYGEDKTVTVLFDAGNNVDAFLHNIRKMRINMEKIDYIVISHGHYDHTGGIIEALKLIKKKTPIILHPNALYKKYALKPKLRYIGIPYSEREIERAGGIIVKNRKPLEIAPGIVVLGEIPRLTDYENTSGFYFEKDGILETDELLDDQAIAIKMHDGIIILSGCGHSGIVNISKYALEATNHEKIRYVIGGFHLIHAEHDRIKKTVKYLVEKSVEKIAPIHCSGNNIICEIKQKQPRSLLELHAGDQIIIK